MKVVQERRANERACETKIPKERGGVIAFQSVRSVYIALLHLAFYILAPPSQARGRLVLPPHSFCSDQAVLRGARHARWSGLADCPGGGGSRGGTTTGSDL